MTDMTTDDKSVSALRARFDKFVDRSGGPLACWPWIGSIYKSRNGNYGHIRFAGKICGAHRISYLLANGELPSGLQVLHRCDNPICVNPAHLFGGTRSDNMKDMYAKGRHTHPHRLGQLNPSAKLSRSQAEKVVASIPSLKRGDISRMAREMGVSSSTVRLIVNGTTWVEIPRG